MNAERALVEPVIFPPRRPIVVASNVLLTERNEVLMGFRKDCMLWENPGGKVEAESIIDAGRREHLEETGMKLVGEPIQMGFVDSWDHWGVKGKQWYVCQFLLWRKWEGFPQLCEGKHLEWRWFKLDSLPLLTQMTHGSMMFYSTVLPRFIFFDKHKYSAIASMNESGIGFSDVESDAEREVLDGGAIEPFPHPDVQLGA